MSIAVPLLIKYVAPVLISFVVGHISGWIHRGRSIKAGEEKEASPIPK